MGAKTGISWCDATFNPWWGCTKVSPACDHCYAERAAKRFAPGRVLWGVDAERRVFGDDHWDKPQKWARQDFAECDRCGWRGNAAKAPTVDRPGETTHVCPACARGTLHKARRRVFCASMGDWFDLDAPLDQFVRLLDTIRLTPELDWLLLSKRIGNWRKRLLMAEAQIIATGGDHDIVGHWLAGEAPANVWLGATVVNQEEADRDIPKLLAVPAAVRFVSIEPMLGPIDIQAAINRMPWRIGGGDAGLHWVIAGGESGPHARPAHPDWLRSLRDQCAAAGVPFHFKQWGEWTEQDADKPTRTFSMDTDIGQTLAARCNGFVSPSGRFVADMDHAQTDEPYRGMFRVGTKIAGRLLDGVLHDAFPV